jgi:hypothetical protein
VASSLKFAATVELATGFSLRNVKSVAPTAKMFMFISV